MDWTTTENTERGKVELITLSEAATIYQQIVGRRKSVIVLSEEIRQRRHLGLYHYDPAKGRERFLGVRRGRWIHFVRTRFALYGAAGVFHYQAEGQGDMWRGD